MNLWLNDPAAFQDDWQELRALQSEVAARQQSEQALAGPRWARPVQRRLAHLLARLLALLSGWTWGAR